MITANHLQHLVIINSTLKFVKYHLQNDLLGAIELEHITNIKKNLKFYKHTLKDLKKTTKYVSKQSLKYFIKLYSCNYMSVLFF